MNQQSRRRYLAITGTAGLTTIAGCLGFLAPDEERPAVDEPNRDQLAADRSVSLAYDTERLRDERIRVAQKDGIPSIDAPTFSEADDPPSNLDDGDPVFGLVLDGEARAYPQHILVWHEVVNDEVAGIPVAVTYCPLTGTAQAFYRHDTGFSPSGILINSNLVMYDWKTETQWAQIPATSITPPHDGETLQEFPLVWTTWSRWVERYPETLVLEENTGYIRNYVVDPYGEYNPPKGYYSDDDLLYPALATDDRLPPKEVVVGCRSADGSMAVQKTVLRERTVIEGTVDDVPYVTVYDPGLDTGYVYRNPEAATVAFDDGQIAVNGETAQPNSLPLARQIAFDAMWFAWYGYYSDTVVHGPTV
jgi:hypothetical protein